MHSVEILKSAVFRLIFVSPKNRNLVKLHFVCTAVGRGKHLDASKMQNIKKLAELMHGRKNILKNEDIAKAEGVSESAVSKAVKKPWKCSCRAERQEGLPN